MYPKVPVSLMTWVSQWPVHAQIGKLFEGLGGRGETSNPKIDSGLKEALRIGTERAVELTGVTNGFFKNDAIKIRLPERVRIAERALRLDGMKIDEFELSMNRAAENAAPAARGIFNDALTEMTFDDARRILTGTNTSATEYFQGKAFEELTAKFRPVVEAAMSATGVVTQYKQVARGIPSRPFARRQNFDITDYVAGKALDGLFYMLGQEEQEIRTNPAARITPLLKEVFGKR